jgi:hypothetical protein
MGLHFPRPNWASQNRRGGRQIFFGYTSYALDRLNVVLRHVQPTLAWQIDGICEEGQGGE